jgi:hypothetical protein
MGRIDRGDPETRRLNGPRERSCQDRIDSRRTECERTRRSRRASATPNGQSSGPVSPQKAQDTSNFTDGGLLARIGRRTSAGKTDVGDAPGQCGGNSPSCERPARCYWPRGLTSSNTVRPPSERDTTLSCAIATSTSASGDSRSSTSLANVSSRANPCSFSVWPSCAASSARLRKASDSPYTFSGTGNGCPSRRAQKANYRTESLNPERIAETGQECRAPVVMDDALGDGRAERRHARRQPRPHTAAVQREIGNARALHPIIVSPERGYR